MACISCKQNVTLKGISIQNHCLEGYPSEVEICKTCVEKIAVGFMTGSFSIKDLPKLLNTIKGIKR